MFVVELTPGSGPTTYTGTHDVHKTQNLLFGIAMVSSHVGVYHVKEKSKMDEEGTRPHHALKALFSCRWGALAFWEKRKGEN